VAITAATLTSGFSGALNPDQSAPIFDRAARMSAVQRLARQVPLGIGGNAVPVTTGRLSAGWVSEGAAKPASAGTMSIKTMSPKKLAVIAVVSAEVVRANPGGYMDNIRDQVAEAFAAAFDSAALYGTSTPFTTYIDQTSSAVELGTTTQANGGVFGDLNSALSTLVSAGKELTGWALDVRMEPKLNGAVDTTGRPIFIEPPYADTTLGDVREGRLLGRRAMIAYNLYKASGVKLGFGGDWTQAAWGTVGGINYDVSTESAVTINGALVSLFENNLVAVRAEAEYGWLVNDVDAFVRITDAT
jgi:HK97 family phage major capsid protein